MSSVCPRGHLSTTDDYCDECGSPLGPSAPAPSPPAGQTSDAGGPPGSVLAPPTAVAACPRCATPNSGGLFCEACGASLTEPEVGAVASTGASATGDESPGDGSPGLRWEVVVAPDRQFFERIDADGAQFPTATGPRVFVMSGDCVAIGRASQHRGIVPDIDLAVPPADTAVSHRHAELRRQPAGGWAVVDCGSANGTYLNDAPEPLPSGELVAISDGDRIHLGAWTTIDVRVRR